MANNKELSKLMNSDCASTFISTVLRDLEVNPDIIAAPKFEYWPEWAVDENEAAADDVLGLYDPDENTIRIFGCNEQCIDDIKMTMRHELLHAILFQLGREYKDTSIEFISLALKYKAFPYGLAELLGVSLEDMFEDYLQKKRAKHGSNSNS